MTRPPTQIWPSVILGGVFVFFFGFVVYRLYEMQVVNGESLKERFERQQVTVSSIPAPRGEIRDVEGQSLAVSIGSWECYADPAWMDDKLRAVVELAPILKVDRDVIRGHLESGKNGRLLARDLTEEQVGLIKVCKLQGVELKRTWRREYPGGFIAPHLMGFVLNDGKGGAGLELKCESMLAGIPGRLKSRTDAFRRLAMDGESEVEPPRPGAVIELTIIARLQREMEDSLKELAEKFAPKGACAIAVRPQTGEILAMASWPAFNPLDRNSLNPEVMRNNCLNLVYESGSTMKPLVAGIAVAEGLTRWDERIDCERGLWKPAGRGRPISDHSRKTGGHGMLTVKEGIAVSDNILAAKLGQRIGTERSPQAFYDWMFKLGFGQRTGIWLSGEDSGLMRPRKLWDVGNSCCSVGFGHEMAVTPIQMAMAHAAVANRGKWMPPRIIRSIRRYDPVLGKDLPLPLPKIPESRDLFPPDQALAIQDAMCAVVTEGTAKASQLDGWSMAGKTGTTEKLVDVGGKKVYAKDKHIGSFVAYSPAKPDLQAAMLVMVVVDEPTRSGHYGATVAAPAVKRIMEAGLTLLGIPKDEPPLPPSKTKPRASTAKTELALASARSVQ